MDLRELDIRRKYLDISVLIQIQYLNMLTMCLTPMKLCYILEVWCMDCIYCLRWVQSCKLELIFLGKYSFHLYIYICIPHPWKFEIVLHAFEDATSNAPKITPIFSFLSYILVLQKLWSRDVPPYTVWMYPRMHLQNA